MKLTRRDAIAALAALGAGSGAAGLYHVRETGSSQDREAPGDEQVRAVGVAVAEVVYPSEVTGIEPFVGEFLDARLARHGHGAGLREAVAVVEDRAARWYDGGVVELKPAARDQLLREIGADTADEAPRGSDAERVRYYLVNDLLLALYGSPKGGELVGIENPQGHPGGTDTYQRGPR